MATNIQPKGLSGIAALVLGAAAFGAYKWRKGQRAAGTYDGDGDGKADNAPTAAGINVGSA